MNSRTGRWLPSPSCSGGSSRQRRGTASSGSSSWPDRPTIPLVGIILSHRRSNMSAQAHEYREEEAGRPQQDGRRIQGVLERLRERQDRERIDDRRYSVEHDEEGEKQERYHERPTRIPSLVRVLVQGRHCGEREGGEQGQEGEDRHESPLKRQDDSAQGRRSRKAYHGCDPRRDLRQGPATQDPKSRAKDQEGPSRRGEGIPLESKTPREGIVECDGEAGKGQRDENGRHDDAPPPLGLLGDGRTSSRERGGDLKDREDGEGRKVETSEESDGGTHSDLRHHIGGTRRATRKERVDGDERPDHRERKRSRRSNREGRQDQEEEGRGNRSPVRIGRVEQVTEGTIGPRNQNP